LNIHYIGESWPQIHQESLLTRAPFEIEQHLVLIIKANQEIPQTAPLVAAFSCVFCRSWLASRVTPFLPFTSLSDNDATVQRALDALNRHQWVHLTCHRMPNRQKLFESSFAMCDGPVTIIDIIRPHLQKPEFAFLSACHTTKSRRGNPSHCGDVILQVSQCYRFYVVC